MTPELPDSDPVETQEWLDSVEAVVETDGRERMGYVLDRAIDHAQEYGVKVSAGLSTPYVNTIRVDEEPPLPGRPGARAACDGARPLERDCHRAAGERRVDRARWPHRELSVGRDAVRDGLQPFLAGAVGRPRRRPHLHAGPLVSRDLRAGVPRGTVERGSAPPLPPRGRRRRALVVPASVADARVLAVPHGLDGPRPADGDLSGPFHEVPHRARRRRHGRSQGVGLHGRRRDGRARVDGCDLARRA